MRHFEERIFFAVILHKLAEEAVVVIADRLVERERMAGHFEDAAGIVNRQAGGFGDFLRIRLAAKFLDEFGRHGSDLTHRVDHVDRQTDRAALVGDRAGDRLANPPRGVGRELVAAGGLELVDRPHQAGIAFLDEVQEAEAPVAVTLGDRDDEPQVAGR